VSAVALGATLIEKHLTMSRADGGPDSLFSLEPQEFKSLVDAVRTTEKALGQVQYGPTPHEMKTRAYRRSLFVISAMKKGEAFTCENVRSIRPADGLHPRHLPEVVGRHASADIERGTPLTWGLVE